MISRLLKRHASSSLRKLAEKSLRTHLDSSRRPVVMQNLDDNQSGNIDMFDGRSLVKVCNAAARNSITDPEFWKKAIARAKELGDGMSCVDLANFIGVTSKSRFIRANDLEVFFPLIKSNTSRLTAGQLGSVFSAYAKSGLKCPDVAETFLRELRARLHEFISPTELSLASNCLQKFEVKDDLLMRRFAGHLQSRIGPQASTPLHVRDASVMALALSTLPGFPTSALEKIAEQAAASLADATPLELCRLIQAFSRLPSCRAFVEKVAAVAGTQAGTLKPEELSTAIFAFGQASEKSRGSLELEFVISRLVRGLVDSLPLFQARELCLVIQTLSRWKLRLKSCDVEAVIDRLGALLAKSQDAALLAEVLSAAVSLGKPPGAAVLALGKLCKPVIQAAVCNLEIPTLARAVDAFNQLGMFDASFQASLIPIILSRHSQVTSNRNFRATVHAALASNGVPHDDDVMLLLNPTD